MQAPSRGTVLLPGTFVLPPSVREEGRLVYREPLRDTMVPLAVVLVLALLCCYGFASAGPEAVRTILLLAAGGFSFLTAALASSLLRRPEVVLDRGAGTLRVRRPEHPPLEIPLADLRAVTVETVRGAGEVTARAAAVETREGRWLPLHVAWSPRRGGEPARAGEVAREIAEFAGLPVEDRGP